MVKMIAELGTTWTWIAVLAGMLSIGVFAVLIAARKTNYTLPQCFVYALGRFFAHVVWRASIDGRLPVSDGEGAVVICNHRGPFDPAFIQLTTNRVVHWMVAREYCESRAFGWFLRIPECIPVGRGGVDTAATKLAIRYAEQGGLVGMFPEGRLNMTDEFLLPGRPGAALVALKARVRVIPCYISGSPVAKSVVGALFRRTRTHLVVGTPIDISEYYGREREREVREELTRKFLSEIAKLAGIDDFEPRLAGRHWKPEETPAE